jgi:mannosyltransferase
MKIYLDNVIFSLQRAGGISVYWYELLRRMLRDGVALQAIEIDRIEDNIFRAKLNLPQELILSSRAFPKLFSRYLPPFVALPKDCLFHSSYYRVPWNNASPTVQTAYDFTYERFRTGPPRTLHSAQKRIALQRAQGVICISESTKRDLLQYIPSVKGERIRVIYLGYSDEFRPIQETADQQLVKREIMNGLPYLVFVGDRSPYKNFHLAVQAVSAVTGYGLVVVGGGRLNSSECALLDEKLRGRFLHLDRLPNEELNALYNRAHALLYPSSYEGFGIPVIEAMAAGCPVIAVNSSSIPEAAGTAGLLVDEVIGGAFAERIIALENSTLRESLIQSGFVNVKRFSWEKCYQETLDFYKDIYQGVSQ